MTPHSWSPRLRLDSAPPPAARDLTSAGREGHRRQRLALRHMGFSAWGGDAWGSIAAMGA